MHKLLFISSHAVFISISKTELIARFTKLSLGYDTRIVRFGSIKRVQFLYVSFKVLGDYKVQLVLKLLSPCV